MRIARQALVIIMRNPSKRRHWTAQRSQLQPSKFDHLDKAKICKYVGLWLTMGTCLIML